MPATRRSKKDVVSEFRHAEILDAARRVFARRGFSEASVEEIAQAAGLAKGTLYLYYRSKRELYWAALRDGLLGLGEELARQVASAPNIRAKIRAFVATKVSYFEAHRDFVQIYYAEFGNALAHPWAPLQNFRDLYDQQIRVLRGAIRVAVKKRELAAVPEEPAACAVFDLTRGVITRRLLGWSRARAQEDVEFVANLAWRGLGPR